MSSDLDALAAGLSPAASRYLVANATRRDPKPAPLSVPEALSAAFDAFEQTWSGWSLGRFSFGTGSGADTAATTLNYLGRPTDPPLAEAEGKPLAPVGAEYMRSPLWLDERGGIWTTHGYGKHSTFRRAAPNIERFVERVAVAAWVEQLPERAELDRRLAALVAEKLGLEALGASDDDAGYFGEPDTVAVFDGRAFDAAAPTTTVVGDAEQLRRVLLAAQEVASDVGAFWFAGEREQAVAAPTDRPLPELGPGVLPQALAPGVWRPVEGVAGVIDVRDGLRRLDAYEGQLVREIGEQDVLYQEARERVEALIGPLPADAAQQRVVFDPRLVMPEQELREALEARGMPPTPAVLEQEATLGGLSIGDPFYGLALGFRRTLEFSGLDEGPRVTFGSTGSDGRVVVDADARFWLMDDIDGSDIRLADSVRTFLRRHFEPMFRGTPVLTVLDHVGARLVADERLAHLELVYQDDVSDGAERLWKGPSAQLYERDGREGELHTVIAVERLDDVDAIGQVLAEVAPEATCRTRFGDVRERLEARGLTVQRSANEKLLVDPADQVAETVAAIEAGEPIAQRWTAHPSPLVRLAVARREDATADDLRAVLAATAVDGLEELAVVDLVARHPAADQALITQLVGLELPTCPHVALRAVAMRADLPASLVETFAAHPEATVRHALVVSNARDAVAPHLARLAADPHPAVRLAVAAHPSTPSEALATLAADSDRQVAYALATHPALPADAAAVLAERPDGPFIDTSSADVPPRSAIRAAYHPWASRQRMAGCPSLPEEALRDLAASPMANSRRGVAQNPATPRDLLERLQKDGDEPARTAAAKQIARRDDPDGSTHASGAFAVRQLPDDIPLADLLREPAIPSRGSFARHPTWPAELLHTLVDHGDILVGYSLPSHPFVPEAVLAAVAQHSYAYARSGVASHWLTPVDTLATLTADPQAMVRAAAIANARTPLEAALAGAADEDPIARGALGGRADCPEDIRERLAEDPHEYARRGVAMSPHTPVSLLERMARDEHVQVRSRLPLNPAFPADACRALLRDPERIVQDAATWRLLETEPLATVLGWRDAGDA